jgi:hypothetical protein
MTDQELNALPRYGMNERETFLRLLKTSLMNKLSIPSALWFKEFLVVNTKELLRLILLTPMVLSACCDDNEFFLYQ